VFLFGRDDRSRRQILEFVYYDDVDSHALDTDIVNFAGNKLPVLWEHAASAATA
jgi:hypothetical protein